MNHRCVAQQMIGLAFATLLLVGGCVPVATPTPDRVATGVAEAKAIAATLTAEAPTATPTATATDTPLPTATSTPPTATLTSTLTPTPAGGTIVGQIARKDEVPRTTMVIPCLMVGEDVCRSQQAWVARVSDEGSFEIAGIAPGTYTFLYGPDSAADTLSMLEDKLIHLESLWELVNSFDLDFEPDGCRYMNYGERVYVEELDEYLYEVTITDTVWLDPVSLQIDFPGGVDWGILGPMSPQGPEYSVALQVEVKEGETTNVILRVLGCEDQEIASSSWGSLRDPRSHGFFRVFAG